MQEMLSAPIRWYEWAAPLYDLGTFGDQFYGAARRRAIDRLQLTAGETVLDVCCGTGVNFSLLRERIGNEGAIVGADGSEQMLRRARHRAAENDAVLLRADFSTDSGICTLTDAARQHDATAFLFTLGLTCLPNWRAFLSAVYEAAPGGARFAIMDVYGERLTPGVRLLNWIGAAECRRPVWEDLERRTKNFQKTMIRPFKVFGAEVLDASVVVASGRKPEEKRDKPQ